MFPRLAAQASLDELPEATELIEKGSPFTPALDAEHWQEVCDGADLSHVDSKLFAGRQFLNSYALEGLDDHMALQNAFRAARDLLISG